MEKNKIPTSYYIPDKDLIKSKTPRLTEEKNHKNYKLRELMDFSNRIPKAQTRRWKTDRLIYTRIKDFFQQRIPLS